MGTLFNQPERGKTVAQNMGIFWDFVSKVFPYKWAKGGDDFTPEELSVAAQVMTACLRLQDADTRDEQLAGFGELLQIHNEGQHKIAEALEAIASELRKQ